MTLWTILPTEMILSNMNIPTVYEEVTCNNMKLLVEKVGSTQYMVSRLLTTDPQDYLRPEMQPGTILTYKPILQINS
jgi:hypothetical protein